ncbi:MAG: leucine-rich repeat protein [Treponema sp.]|nr:leucine-rich repeat protein [Treponema sp.]
MKKIFILTFCFLFVTLLFSCKNITNGDSAKYTITFCGNGGITANNKIQYTVSEYSGSKVILTNNFIYNGYKFIGWAESNTSTTAQYSELTSYEVKNTDLVLYAVWSKLYYITFDSNGGTGNVLSVSGISGSTVKLADNSFEKDGYIFTGWSTNSSSSTVNYTDGDSVTISDSDIILYAVWDTLYTLKFDSNGGIGEISSLKGMSGKMISLTANTFTNNGYLFAGWSESKNDRKIKYYDGSTFTFDNSSVTLYAVWVNNTISGSCGKNAKWAFSTSTGELVIYGYGEMYGFGGSYTGDLEEVPWYIYMSLIKSVIIGEGITSIGAQSFYGCENLLSIYIPTTLTSIGSWSFNNCSSLTSLELPDTIKEIGSWAFANCKLLSDFNFPKSLVVIDHGILYSCISLKTITIPDSVTTINGNAFDSCTFTSISIPDSVITISGGFIQEKYLTTVTLPDTIKSIETAFANCTSLTTINLPNSIADMSKAFYNCTSLTEITIPNSVTDCSYAFEQCTNLKKINIQNGLTSIPKYAFYDCTGLEEISIPESLLQFDSYAFYGCTGLKNIIIPSSLITIKSEALSNCTGISSIKIPSSVLSIETDSFFGWKSYQTIDIQGYNEAPSTWSSYWNDGCSALINWNN